MKRSKSGQEISNNHQLRPASTTDKAKKSNINQKKNQKKKTNDNKKSVSQNDEHKSSLTPKKKRRNSVKSAKILSHIEFDLAEDKETTSPKSARIKSVKLSSSSGSVTSRSVLKRI